MTEVTTTIATQDQKAAPAQSRRQGAVVHANGVKRGEHRLPPLESGDRLTRAEFERRYRARPDLKKAELIERVVYVASPVRIQQHGEPHSRIVTWIGVYVAQTPGLRFADNGTYRMDTDNEPQPDVSVWIDPALGGGAFVNDEDYLEGTPELLIEVAASSAAYDLHEKLHAYRRNGIQEYLVLQVYEQATTWYRWQEGEYQEIPPDAEGILRSARFPGLWFDPAKFWAGDLAGVLAVLQAGLAIEAHQAFRKELEG
jgi:Uma2 family endonuclease